MVNTYFKLKGMKPFEKSMLLNFSVKLFNFFDICRKIDDIIEPIMSRRCSKSEVQISLTSISLRNIYRFNLGKTEVRSLDRMTSWLREYYCQILLIKLIMNLSSNDLYNSVLIMLDSLQIFEEDFSNLAIQSSH